MAQIAARDDRIDELLAQVPRRFPRDMDTPAITASSFPFGI
jgi:hypothetical protein